MAETPKRAFPSQVLRAIRRGDCASLLSRVASGDLPSLSWMLLGAEIITGGHDKRLSHAYDLTQVRMAELEAVGPAERVGSPNGYPARTALEKPPDGRLPIASARQIDTLC